MLSWEFPRGDSVVFIGQLYSTDQNAETRRGKAASQGHWVHREDGKGRQPWELEWLLLGCPRFYPSTGQVKCHLSHLTIELWWPLRTGGLHFCLLPWHKWPTLSKFQSLICQMTFCLSWLSYKRYRIKNSHPWPTRVMTMIRYTLSVKWSPLTSGGSFTRTIRDFWEPQRTLEIIIILKSKILCFVLYTYSFMVKYVLEIRYTWR